MVSQPYLDLFQLSMITIKYEILPREKDKRHTHREDINLFYTSDFDKDQINSIEVTVAQMAIDKPYTYQALKPINVKEKSSIMTRAKESIYYSFDISRMEEIFNMLLADGQIWLTECQKIPTKEEL